MKITRKIKETYCRVKRSFSRKLTQLHRRPTTWADLKERSRRQNKSTETVMASSRRAALFCEFEDEELQEKGCRRVPSSSMLKMPLLKAPLPSPVKTASSLARSQSWSLNYIEPAELADDIEVNSIKSEQRKCGVKAMRFERREACKARRASAAAACKNDQLSDIEKRRLDLINLFFVLGLF
jgi:hypothetical protein